LLAIIAVAGVLGVAVAAQVTIPPEAQKHIDAARAAAGSDHAGLFTAVCDTARSVIAAAAAPPRAGGPGRGGRAGGPPGPPPRESWYAEPVKVFDNLYFVGQSEYSAWAQVQLTRITAMRLKS
jgi:metallo-beta-lactamase class B